MATTIIDPITVPELTTNVTSFAQARSFEDRCSAMATDLRQQASIAATDAEWAELADAARAWDKWTTFYNLRACALVFRH
jgi:hypothetical protein